MTSDNYAVSTQAQALACLLALDARPVPEALRLFDSTPDLVHEFSRLAFAGATPEQLQGLARCYAPLAGKPTLQAGAFQAILAFCTAAGKRLEAAGVHLAQARLVQDAAPPHYARWYRHTVMQQLMTAADELACV